MSWNEIIGHEELVERFRRSAARHRLAGTYLFVGPAGIGKRTFALKLAQALLCETVPEEQFEPCGECPGCTQVKALTHPDLDVVGRPEDKNFIPIETFIGDREHRMREGLCHRISLKPYRGNRRVAIIDDADDLNIEGANCLLKTLEEPPSRAVIVLLATSVQKQLPTIRSRSQIVQFQPLAIPVVARLLVERSLVSDPEKAQQLAELSEGSIQTALDMSDPGLLEYRGQFLEGLTATDGDSVALAKQLNAFVEEAGKEAPPRRRRLRQVIAVAASYYRQIIRCLAGAGPVGDPQLVAAAERGANQWKGDMLAAITCLERCLDADQQVASNAHAVTLVDCFVDDLMESARAS